MVLAYRSKPHFMAHRGAVAAQYRPAPSATATMDKNAPADTRDPTATSIKGRT